MYDVMATPIRGRRSARRAAQQASRGAREESDLDTDWSPARHRAIAGEEVVGLLPALANREPSGGYLFYDCQTDDVRLVLTVLGEAERFGAICANRLEVCGLLEPGEEGGVIVRDAVSTEQFPVRAANVINAAGVWADRIRPEELHSEAEVPRIVPSRGTHVTIGSADLPLGAGAIVPAGDGRSIFALPWLGRSLVGTTDNNYEGDIDHVSPSSDDIEYLLEAVNSFFRTELDADDLVGAYAGVRPLISPGDARKSVDISRKAELYETSSGLITITGGKLTTWRRMAKLAVDRLVEREGRDAPCRTQEIPLGQPVDPSSLRRIDGVDEDSYEALASRYGHAAEGVLELAAADPALAGAIVDGQPDLLAEVPFAARDEQADAVGDILLRRTRLGILAGPEVCAEDKRVPRRVAEALGRELGWDSRRVALELDRFAEEAVAEGIPAR